jgi:hypothetical protein
MRRALLLSVVLVSGCHQAAAPQAADASAQNAANAKTNKEMTDLLRKADAIAATGSTPTVSAPEPVPPQPVSGASVTVAAADVHPATPAKSKADVMRDQAAATFGDRLGALRRTAEAARLKKDRYSQLCQGKAATQSECQVLTIDVADASKMIERELGDIGEAARLARIDPGVMHDLLAKYGF